MNRSDKALGGRRGGEVERGEGRGRQERRERRSEVKTGEMV